MFPEPCSPTPSKYIELYDIIIPKNHLLRQINELVDFSFVREELSDK